MHRCCLSMQKKWSSRVKGGSNRWWDEITAGFNERFPERQRKKAGLMNKFKALKEECVKWKATLNDLRKRSGSDATGVQNHLDDQVRAIDFVMPNAVSPNMSMLQPKLLRDFERHNFLDTAITNVDFVAGGDTDWMNFGRTDG